MLAFVSLAQKYVKKKDLFQEFWTIFFTNFKFLAIRVSALTA